ncbi:LysM peptidoglycan-binding domain-containing protein [Winogradskyella jejuensis]|uniref:Amino acid/amide ABC transporter substrate-binding protein, HAAT family n=1 Tax=Winogradskyella jejuensis TaxID=1089305 RepID=A0A1M5SE43_9FLAO|nr:LysM peptidoglycan-binding domain-containing protein [Winogradskyella jejuensis]SHH36705.1 amino acid/amide ABC transporter substrate-binding protein, HAAT family [Winogradskyella jejuensis]
MKNFLAIIIFVFSFCASAQNYKTHKVKSGETIESIAKRYLVTPFDIYALNPDAKADFAPNMTLIIPNSKVKNDEIVEPSKEIIDYKKHKVKRKETLYGLSKQYKVTEDEIKKANPRLYSENLRKGDRIRIPRYKTVVSKQTLSNTIKKYTVQPSEGKWRIAYKFGITVQELEDLNPNMNEVIQPGDELNVPNIANNEEKPTDTEYNFYEVQPKEGFFRLKVKLGLTQEQLEELNPGLEETGLKSGMVLKVPSDVEVASTLSEDFDKTDLRDNIKNTDTKRLALLLPFKLHLIDIDSVAEVKAMMKSDKVLSTALDFHSGVLMALDSAKELGISTDLKVFDTENRTAEVANIVDNEDFSNYDAVIGPMMTKTFDRFAAAVNSDNVPVFAPLALPTKVSRNVYQTIPEKKILSQRMVNYIKADSTKTQVVIIADQKHKEVSNNLKKEFPVATQLFSEVNKKGKDKGKDAYFIYPTTFEGVFKPGKNIVFLETDDVSFGSSIISLLNGLSTDKIEIILTTTHKSKAFESKDPDNNYHLSNLKFHYATINKEYDGENANAFVKQYTERYSVSPSKYATRGYDLTMDILLRLSAEEGFGNSDTETEYIENKFRYNKKLFGGYVNEASYIVKFDNLKIVEVD